MELLEFIKINMLKKSLNKNIFLTLIILFSAFIFSIFPLLHNGFFPTFDDVQVVRIEKMFLEIKSGQFPVRYVNDLGNNGGYFLFNYYSPVVYYIGALIHFLGFSLVKATKLTFILGYFIGTLGSFFLLRKYLRSLFSAFGSLIFITATYVGYDIYTRGDLPEFFAIMLSPWLWFCLKSLKDKYINLFIFGIFFALIISTHHITGFISSIFVFLYFLFYYKDKKIRIRIITGILIGLGISAFYWLPVVGEINLIALKTNPGINSQYVSNFLNPLQIGGLMHINWGFRPPLLGINLFLFTIIAIFYFMKKKKETENNFLIVSIVGLFFLISGMSYFLWKNIFILEFVQFPWRFLTILTLFSVILIFKLINEIKNKPIKIFCLLILCLMTLLNYSYLRPSTYNYIAIYKAEDICSTTTWQQEYLPKNVIKCLPKNKLVPLIQADKGQIISNFKNEKNGRNVLFTVIGNKGEINFAKYYFPAWRVLVNGKPISPSVDEKYGTIRFEVPSGSNNVRIYLSSTQFEMFGNLISIVTILLLPLIYKLRKYESSN